MTEEEAKRDYPGFYEMGRKWAEDLERKVLGIDESDVQPIEWRKNSLEGVDEPIIVQDF